MQFVYEAMRPDGSSISERIDAAGRNEAAESLRDKGLILLKLDEAAGDAIDGAGADGWLQSGQITVRDLVLFTRQMKMLLESGAPLVPALEAAEMQSSRPVVRRVLRQLRVRVEEGASLTDALEDQSEQFDSVFRSMVAAGEATATLPGAFGRLANLAQQQAHTRKLIYGALLYPALLSVLLFAVVLVLLLFVVPRFHMLFINLHSTLPVTTELLFNLSRFLQTGWPYLVAGGVALIIGLAFARRSPLVHTALTSALLRIPAIGPLYARVTIARVLRIWAALFSCHVPLLDAIRQSRLAVRNERFALMLKDVEEAVEGGGRIGVALAESGLVATIITSAIRTGEENGRLAEAVEFVSTWMDEDNASAIHNLTRLAEPMMLGVMGIIVGFVAMALFVPLFDLATAT